MGVVNNAINFAIGATNNASAPMKQVENSANKLTSSVLTLQKKMFDFGDASKSVSTYMTALQKTFIGSVHQSMNWNRVTQEMFDTMQDTGILTERLRQGVLNLGEAGGLSFQEIADVAPQLSKIGTVLQMQAGEAEFYFAELHKGTRMNKKDFEDLASASKMAFDLSKGALKPKEFMEMALKNKESVAILKATDPNRYKKLQSDMVKQSAFMATKALEQNAIVNKVQGAFGEGNAQQGMKMASFLGQITKDQGVANKLMQVAQNQQATGAEKTASANEIMLHAFQAHRKDILAMSRFQLDTLGQEMGLTADNIKYLAVQSEGYDKFTSVADKMAKNPPKMEGKDFDQQVNTFADKTDQLLSGIQRFMQPLTELLAKLDKLIPFAGATASALPGIAGSVASFMALRKIAGSTVLGKILPKWLGGGGAGAAGAGGKMLPGVIHGAEQYGVGALAKKGLLSKLGGRALSGVPLIGGLMGGAYSAIDEYGTTGSMSRALGRGLFSGAGGELGGLIPGVGLATGVAGAYAGDKLFDAMFGASTPMMSAKPSASSLPQPTSTKTPGSPTIKVDATMQDTASANKLDTTNALLAEMLKSMQDASNTGTALMQGGD